jgi:predicted ribosomally synthesized peptide with nif11-like leader
MNSPALAKFLERLSSDPALQARVQTLPEGVDAAEALAQISTEIGEPVSAEEFRAAAAESPSGELSEKELEGVAGGLAFTQGEIEEMLRQSMRGKGPFSGTVSYQRPGKQQPFNIE